MGLSYIYLPLTLSDVIKTPRSIATQRPIATFPKSINKIDDIFGNNDILKGLKDLKENFVLHGR